MDVVRDSVDELVARTPVGQWAAFQLIDRSAALTAEFVIVPPFGDSYVINFRPHGRKGLLSDETILDGFAESGMPDVVRDDIVVRLANYDRERLALGLRGAA